MFIKMEDLVESDFDFNTATTLYKNGDKVTILLARANNGKQYVVKRLKVSSIGDINALLKESYAMMGLNHENIIKIHAGLARRQRWVLRVLLASDGLLSRWGLGHRNQTKGPAKELLESNRLASDIPRHGFRLRVHAK